MRCSTRLMLVQSVLATALACPALTAGEQGGPIDLSSFEEVGSILSPTVERESAAAMPLVPVVSGGETLMTRLYVSGIVGASFATVATGGSSDFLGTAIRQAGSVNETIFTGGGAVGMAFERPSGLLRMEVEGRARGPMSGQSSLIAEGEGLPLDVTATNGWSTTTNFWRDYFLSDTVGMYAGGGFGAGGYRYSVSATDGAQLTGSNTVTTFAWQVGTGVVYQVSEKVTIDTGYRFFAMTPAPTSLSLAGVPGLPLLGLGDFSSAFSASELLVSVRIYEPFRNWR